MVKVCSLLLNYGLVLFIGSCSVFKKSNQLEVSTFMDRLDTIPLKKEKYELILIQDSISFNFSKSFTMDFLKQSMDTLNQNIEKGLYTNTSESALSKYLFLLEKIKAHDTIHIANIPYIDSLSLENMGYLERMETIEKDENLRFGSYFYDLFCPLMELGNLSIQINDLFVDTIYKNRYSIFTKLDGSSAISYTTKEGIELYRCRSYFRYN